MIPIGWLMIVFAAVVGSAAITGVIAWLVYRSGGSQLTVEGGELQSVLRELETVHERLDAVRDDVARLRERADFTDRLLESGERIDTLRPGGRGEGE